MDDNVHNVHRFGNYYQATRQFVELYRKKTNGDGC